jgi:hypothetical protein
VLDVLDFRLRAVVRVLRFAAFRPVVVVPVLLRRLAALFACFASAVRDSVDFGSRLSAFMVARLRFGAGFERFGPAFVPRSACFRVFSGTAPRLGVLSGTPARRAFDSPIAIACFRARSEACRQADCQNCPMIDSPLPYGEDIGAIVYVTPGSRAVLPLTAAS